MEGLRLVYKNPLEKYFYENNGRLIHKWLHYFEIYHRYFSQYRSKKITVLEFGVSHGGSLQMWRSYFGKEARIIGVDINPECKKLEEEGVTVYIADQSDRASLQALMRSIGPVDIVIEDGGHRMDQQINTFEIVFPYVNEGGVFLIEDLHTSYWERYGAGVRKQGTFIEYAKGIIDDMHAWHSEDEKEFSVNKNTEQIPAMHIHDSIIVFEKGRVVRPVHEMTGNRTLGR